MGKKEEEKGQLNRRQRDNKGESREEEKIGDWEIKEETGK